VRAVIKDGRPIDLAARHDLPPEPG
jgi:hypothetical protein